MKPAWDKLMSDFSGSASSLVADVDCTESGKDLCEKHGVQGFPTIKYGDPHDLKDYSGGRDYEGLKKFADENLKPMCSPSNIDLCDDDKKAEIEKFQAMPSGDLDALIKEKEDEMDKAEKDFKDGVSELQATYQKMMADKEATIDAIKASGLSLMKAVKAAAPKGSDEL